MIIKYYFETDGTSTQVLCFGFGGSFSPDDVLVTSSWRLEQDSITVPEITAAIRASLYASREAAESGVPFNNSYYSQELSSGTSLITDVDMLDTFIIGNGKLFLRVQSEDIIDCCFSLVGKLRKGTETELAQLEFGDVLVV
jgi:hypothetical protein